MQTIRFFLLLFVVASTFTASAQDTIITLHNKGKVDSLPSRILQQTRYVEVITPAGYEPGSDTKYDVLYVLDGGNWNTGLISRTIPFIEGEGYMPPTIIVSVMGIDRNKDLTPTVMEGWKTSGGAPNFLAFLQTELIPYIDAHYPSNGDNTLWGHSLGGLFVTYALLAAPATFKSYIAVDPSMWWDNGYAIRLAEKTLPQLPAGNITYYASGRDTEGMKDMKIDSLEWAFNKYAPAQLQWKIQSYPGESHSSVRLKTIYDGLKFSYAGLAPELQFHPMNGIVLKDSPYHVWYFDDLSRIRYNTNGTVPTSASPNAVREITLKDSATVIYKRFTNRSRYDNQATGKFTTAPAPKPVKKPKDIVAGGLSYAYYEGDWKNWPSLKGMTAEKTGLADSTFDLDKLPRKNKYAVTVDGWVEVKENGYHIFLFNADKASRFYLNGEPLMNWQGSYTNRTYTYLLPLQKGFYAVRVEYLHQNPDFKLELSWLTPSTLETKQPKPIPLSQQFHRKN